MSFQEPTDVGPAYGGDLPVAAGDRTKVLTLLDSAYAEGRLTPAEHVERTQAANLAQTFDDLVPLTRDLVPLDTPTAAPTYASAPASGDTEPEMLVAIFSGRKSIRLFGQKVVAFRAAGTRYVCVRVPFRAKTFDPRAAAGIAISVRKGSTRGNQGPPARVVTRDLRFF